MMTGLIGFDHPARNRIVFGVGGLDRIGELARQLGRSRALLVTDQGIVKVGHADRAKASLPQFLEYPETIYGNRCHTLPIITRHRPLPRQEEPACTPSAEPYRLKPSSQS